MSQSRQIDLTTSIQYLHGVGPARARALEASGITTVYDLFYYFPRRHLDRTSVTPLREIRRDQSATVVGTVEVAGERRARKRKYFQAVISDGTGLLNLVWFRGAPYLAKKIKKGVRLAVSGKIEFFQGHQIVHPEFDLIDQDEDPLHTCAVVPIYPLTGELKKVRVDNRALRRTIRQVLEQIGQIDDLLPAALLERYGLTNLDQALRKIHYAENIDELQQARRRLKFDEHFFLMLLMALRKASLKTGTAPEIDALGTRFQLVYDQLEFDLTGAQQKVIKEIRHDLGHGRPMNRLLQGDVGSGKTIVALLSAAIAIGNGHQVALMAPTEILAQQHFTSIKAFSERAQITCALITGGQKSAERRQLLAALAEGRIDLIVGTHALIQSGVEFARLGLVIIDEQHRFGVVQRGHLLAKGYNPHLLAMTATPIPRTMAITYHGDMDLSIIDELPAHRQPVTTKVVNSDRLNRVYHFIRDEVEEGRQAIVVYPLVEETEKSDLAAATEAFTQLAAGAFRRQQVGLLHGRLKQDEKDAMMAAFAANEINILVATTVIEVGIDVPNASVMLVEHAERFGLTQLHQLRGRVGRGNAKSYCILVQRKTGDTADRRLGIMEETSDGFRIADEDLQIRGPGEFFGARQSGFVKYKIADMLTDGPIIRQARQAAFELVKNDPHLRKPEHAHIRRRFVSEYQHLLELVNIT